MRCLILFFATFATAACERATVGREIVGDIKNLPNTKLYLTDAYRWTVHLDSVVSKNGKFSFRLDANKYKSPFLASIYFVHNNKPEPFPIINYKRSTPSDTQSSTGFFIERGTTVIHGDFNEPRRRMQIRPGKENDLYFDKKTQFFGAVRAGYSRKTFDKLRATVLENPSSHFLIYSLNQNRYYHDPTDLKSLLSLFTPEVQQSAAGRSLLEYADNVIPIGSQFPPTTVRTLENENVELFSDGNELNMFVFWASWCGPCRAEIPGLKELSARFAKSGLSISSVSIDADPAEWRRAVEQEGMPWQQFLLAGSDSMIERYKAHFNISAIPLIVFTDRNRRQVKRFTGYSEGDSSLTKFIQQYLTQKALQ